MAMLAHKCEPTNLHLTSVGVLFSQQADQASSRNILEDINKILGFWTLTREELNGKTREI